MAIIYATPLYIFKVIPFAQNVLIYPLVTIPILIAWLLNIVLLVLVPAPWTKSVLRALVVCLLMFAVSGLVIHLISPLVLLSEASILMVRVVNIISVNAIIYVLIDLTLTKENQNKIELENANLKLVKLEADYKLLKDQINPHFLFNALATAKALIKPKPELAEEYIVRLSEFLRLSINNTKKTVPLAEELQLCIDFITLNQIRFGAAIVLENKISADINNYFVPYFSLLTLIENAIKHNTLSIENPLRIFLTAEPEMLELRNTRNPKFVLDKSTKTGLLNLNERYKLITNKEIQVVETENYFSVKIPILKK